MVRENAPSSKRHFAPRSGDLELTPAGRVRVVFRRLREAQARVAGENMAGPKGRTAIAGTEAKAGDAEGAVDINAELGKLATPRQQASPDSLDGHV